MYMLDTVLSKPFFIEVNYSSTSLSRSYNLKIHMLKIDRRELFDNLTSHTYITYKEKQVKAKNSFEMLFQVFPFLKLMEFLKDNYLSFTVPYIVLT